jgi:hypothetical protein
MLALTLAALSFSIRSPECPCAFPSHIERRVPSTCPPLGASVHGTIPPRSTLSRKGRVHDQVLMRLKGGASVWAAVGAVPAPVLLVITICLEVFGTTCMKLAERSAKWYIGVFLSYFTTFTLFPVVLRSIPVRLVPVKPSVRGSDARNALCIHHALVHVRSSVWRTPYGAVSGCALPR